VDGPEQEAKAGGVLRVFVVRLDELRAIVDAQAYLH